jgi:hypothetical protein
VHEAHTLFRKLVHRFIDPIHDEVQDGEGCWLVIRLGVCKHGAAIGQVQPEPHVALVHLQPQGSRIELFSLSLKNVLTEDTSVGAVQ